MKYLSTLDIINLLQSQGKNVDYRKRSDGGYQIKSIDGTKYSGSTGNTAARKIVNAPLPQKILNQRIKITIQREKKYKKLAPTIAKIKELNKEFKKKYGEQTPYKTRKDVYIVAKQPKNKEGISGKDTIKQVIHDFEEFKKLSKGFIRQFERTKKKWEENENIKGKIKVLRTIKSIHEIGLRATKKKLKGMQLYAEGYANNKNIYWFNERCKAIDKKYGDCLLDDIVVSWAETHKIKDESLMQAYQMLYEIDNGTIEYKEDNVSEVLDILKTK